MKRIILALALIAIGFSSCKKEEIEQDIIDDSPIWTDTTIVVPPTVDSTLTYRFKVTGAALTNNIDKMVIINNNTELLTKNNVITITCKQGDVVEFKLIYMYPDTYQSGKWINVELTKSGNGSNWNAYNWINYYSPTGFGSESYGKSFTAHY